jgi:glycosyltransferase involved in cell wall biosynthesis
MNWNQNQNRRVILNGLFLDKIGKQSGTYFMAVTIIRELLSKDPNYLLITTEKFSWATNQTILVRHFDKRFRFVAESIYRNIYRNAIWLNFDYFLPYQFAGKNRIDIVVVHDLLPLDIPAAVSWFKRNWFRVQVNRSLKLSAAVITISDFCKNQINYHFPGYSNSIHVISNPVDIDRFGIKQEAVPNRNLEKYFVTIAAPWPHKNLSTIFAAFEVLYHKFTTPLYVIGTRFNRSPHNGESGAVKYLGFLDDEDLGQVILHSQAVIAPSLYEGFGMTIYEGLGLGKFVIASNLSVYLETSNLIRVDDPQSHLSWVQVLESFLERQPDLKHIDLQDFCPSVIANIYHNLIIETNAKFK